jgi:hypothetical protein
MALAPFQFQLGSTVFGQNTIYPVAKVDIQTYNIQAQDFQVTRSDEIRMGVDTFAAGPIMFEIGVIDNAPLRNLLGGVDKNLPLDLSGRGSAALTKIQKEWKAEEVKGVWGELKPLLVCGADGVTRRIYGRPRKFTYTRKTPKSQFFRIVAEYARIDTKSYDDKETMLAVTVSDKKLRRVTGDAESWYRALFYGPLNKPKLYINGVDAINLDLDIPAGSVVEVSSYPWARRVVDDKGINWRTKLIGNTKYLDQLSLLPATDYTVKFSAGGTTAASKVALVWRDAHNVV